MTFGSSSERGGENTEVKMTRDKEPARKPGKPVGRGWPRRVEAALECGGLPGQPGPTASSLGLSFPMRPLRGLLGQMPWWPLILCSCTCVDGRKAGLKA